MSQRRILFDLGHPAHVHLFHPVIEQMSRRGHVCRVTARAKDVTTRLLEHYGHRYHLLAPLGRRLSGQLRELIQREWNLFRFARHEAIDLIVGTSVNAARVARYLGIESVIVNEDDVSAVPSWKWLGYPFATRIVTPDCLRYERWGTRHFTYPGNQELFYLHPNRFQADASVRKKLGLHPTERYGVVRLSALQAHHDLLARGITDQLLAEIVDLCEGTCRVLITSERPLPARWEPRRVPAPPEEMLNILALATFVVGDSQTMIAEAAVLGRPAFRLSSFVGKLAYLHDLEQARLAFGFLPGAERQLVDQLKLILQDPHYQMENLRRRERWLASQIDPLPWFCDLLETGPDNQRKESGHPTDRAEFLT